MFPSPYGVLFILIAVSKFGNDTNGKVFPSPYGVSFILIGNVRTREEIAKVFPSPYGVSFILINMLKGLVKVGLGFRLLTEYHSFLWQWKAYLGSGLVVSVSLRSIIHSYLSSIGVMELSRLRVSVSLRSIIHSYFSIVSITRYNTNCFRLLTEYHSFL